MGCIKLHILDEQYKRTELKVSYINKKLTSNFCAENARRYILVRYVDPDGRDPGDVFRTPLAAARDFGMYYNGASILRGIEFGSTIYKYEINGRTYYSYSIAKEGGNDHAKLSQPPNGETVVADVHSHGEYEKGYKNNVFSNKDKWGNYNKKRDGYLTTPDGSLKKYDPYTTKTTIISTDLPSDPKDPERKNEKAPVDIPKEKEYQEQNTREKKIEEYKNSFQNSGRYY